MRLQILLPVVLTLTTQTLACLTMSLTRNGAKAIIGSIVDNNDTKCVINANLDRPGRDDQYWFTCVNGYAAWLSKDLITLAYGHDGENYRLETRNEGKGVSASRWC
jgi:hypothetical protein